MGPIENPTRHLEKQEARGRKRPVRSTVDYQPLLDETAMDDEEDDQDDNSTA
ncbi:MAG: hypothetical protein ABSB88_18510 [Bryobacteraceae bacterium]|jgi:hypothetical protein